jgi:hypothetical protein
LSEAHGVTFSATLPPAVPEPATITLLLTGLAALPVRRRLRCWRGPWTTYLQ